MASWFRGRKKNLNALDASGQNALHTAARLGDSARLQTLLRDGAEVNFGTLDQATALHLAASRGDLDILSILLDQPDIKVNAVDNQRRTPLHAATEAGNISAIELLCDKGANVQLRRADGRNAIDLAISDGRLDILRSLAAKGVKFANLNGSAALLHAAALNAQNAILAFLLDQGIPVDTPFQGTTAIFRTLPHKSSETTRILLDAGASVEQTMSGVPVISLAVFGGNADTVDLVLKYSLDCMGVANTLGDSRYPIEFAVEKAIQGSDEAIISLLLNAGANPQAFVPNKGLSAIDICLIEGRRDLAAIFSPHFEILALEDNEDTGVFREMMPELESFSGLPPIEAPLLVGFRVLNEDWDNLSFADDFYRLDSIKGWDFSSDQPRRVNGATYSEAQVSSFLQEWLLFGLLKVLAQTVGFRCEYRSFLRRSKNGDIFFYSSALEGFVEAWVEGERQAQQEYSLIIENDQSFEQVLKSFVVTRVRMINDALSHAGDVADRVWRLHEIGTDLQKANRVLESLHATRAPSDYSPKPLESLGLVVVLLGQYLSLVRDKLYTPELRLEADKQSLYGRLAAQRFVRTGWISEDYRSTRTFGSPPRVLSTRMLAMGLCPSEVRMLHTIGLSATALYFVSLLDRPHMLKGHSKCSRLKCLVMQVDEDLYETKHVDQCSCVDKHESAFLDVDTNEVTARLEKGGIPVIRFVDKGVDGRPARLEVVDAGKELYVAFSHVWAHGLGNPKSNSLPLCQLRRLAQLAKSAANEASTCPGDGGEVNFDESCFWIDTLCVPVDESGRRLALGLLRNAYQQSFVTLVLDSELMQASPDVSHAERTARVLVSSWMRRLWTLEEGLFCRIGTRYQFSGRSLAHGVEVGGLNEEYETDYEEEISNDLTDALRGMLPPMWEQRYESGHKFLPVLRSCCYRTTSRISDEVICLASVLKLDVSRLLLSTGKDKSSTLVERNKMFYTLLGEEGVRDIGFDGVPIHVLFMDGPRLAEPGFTWAPTGFLARDPSAVLSYSVDPPVAHVRPGGGLKVNMTGWEISIPRSEPDTPVRQDVPWGKTFAFEDEENGCAYTIEPVGEEWRNPPTFSASDLCIMLVEPLLAPCALLIVAPGTGGSSSPIPYGWRVRAVQWSLVEFQAHFNSSPQPQVEVDDPDLSEVLANMELNNNILKERVDRLVVWEDRTLLYQGKKSPITEWVIM